MVCGLDSIVARRWMNSMLHELLTYDSSGQLEPWSIVPMVDGGTEGFKGNARVVLPGMSACIECTLDLYPPQVNFPMCTIAETPRLPEHCVEYVKVLQWPRERADMAIDGDDPDHIKWIYDRAAERAAQYNISGITYRLTQGVVKNIIPAVASTNAVIAAIAANEVFKLATRLVALAEVLAPRRAVSGLSWMERERLEERRVSNSASETVKERSTSRPNLLFFR